jgi:hypothetical protein
MISRETSVRFLRVPGLALGILFVGSGCWWQKNSYTNSMNAGFASYAKRAERERMLGPAIQPEGDFAMSIRPPNPTTLVQTPPPFLLWFQTTDATQPLVELLIMGSGGMESLAEFQQTAFNALKAAAKFPPQDPDRIDPLEVTSMHDNSKMTFEQFQGAGNRQLQQGAAPVGYQWFIFFGEDQSQKIMLCYIIPDSKYPDFYRDELRLSLESLALATKVSLAAGGGGAGAGGF